MTCIGALTIELLLELDDFTLELEDDRALDLLLELDEFELLLLLLDERLVELEDELDLLLELLLLLLLEERLLKLDELEILLLLLDSDDELLLLLLDEADDSELLDFRLELLELSEEWLDLLVDREDELLDTILLDPAVLLSELDIEELAETIPPPACSPVVPGMLTVLLKLDKLDEISDWVGPLEFDIAEGGS